MGSSAEDDAVLVDDIDLALGVDFTSDFGGFGVGVVDFVEGDPFAGVGSAGGLVEIEGGLAADIKGSPVEKGLGGGLLNVDIVSRGCCGIGSCPCASHNRIQAAFYETIGNAINCNCSAG